MTERSRFQGSQLRRKKQNLAAFAIGLVLGGLVAGGGGWALNRYVIDHVQIDDVAAFEAALACQIDGAANPAVSPGVVTGNTYTDGRTRITVTKRVTGSGPNTVTSFLADLTLPDVTVLRSAFAQNKFGKNIIELPSAMAHRADAVFAFNGDYYGFRDEGILIRNGIVYRDRGFRQGLAIYRDGRMAVYDETETRARDLISQGVWNTISFGPSLIENGRVRAGIDRVEIDTNFGNHTIQGRHPRTGVGMVDRNHFVVIVVDGRSPGYSRGVTMPEFAQMFVDAGAKVAYNLDGGGSATMYFDGALVNRPHDQNSKPRERETSDIFFIRRVPG
jgi:hypothetical protein